ncbi:MAG: ABC transporter ATP-binding protein [Candidatus Eisenbacteria sp.]|nr:ABC transporter ATP-binding protein [Candidatus Eisenbacteria bacterium]
MTDTVIPILVEGLRKRYGEINALDGLSLRVEHGEIVGLIGPDGAGKTTAMGTVCGLVRPDDGFARVMGLDCREEGQRVKEHIGYMPQRFSLYSDLTVAENLRFFADLFEVSSSERRERQERLMAFSGLAPFLGRRAGALSGGMKQKLALCCTLIHTPDVLILDEPTTGVDVVSRSEFWTILRDLAGEGMALLVSTPYMEEAALFDRLILMHRGRAVASGTPGEVRSRFGQRLLEVTGPGIAKARERIVGLRWPGVDVHRFGDRLHVVHDLEEEDAGIREALARVDVRVGPVEPTIEDTFISLVTHSPEAAG